MYYQNYEDYMRNVLGYPVNNMPNTYEVYQDYSMPMYESPIYSEQYSEEIMGLYPEIYTIINPMVEKICQSNTKPITKELLDKMTEEIYLNLESDPSTENVVNIRVSTAKDSNSSQTTKETSKSTDLKSHSRSSGKEEDSRETREEKGRRAPNNSILQDLIRILILNQLLRPPFPPNRPRPPRPPFPGPGGSTPPPPRPPVRPPVRPPFPRENRGTSNYYQF